MDLFELVNHIVLEEGSKIVYFNQENKKDENLNVVGCPKRTKFTK
jgi:hypothetical protein